MEEEKSQGIYALELSKVSSELCCICWMTKIPNKYVLKMYENTFLEALVSEFQNIYILNSPPLPRGHPRFHEASFELRYYLFGFCYICYKVSKYASCAPARTNRRSRSLGAERAISENLRIRQPAAAPRRGPRGP